jgi:hypothetical protein
MEFVHKGTVALMLALPTLLAGCNGGEKALPSSWFPASSIYAYMKAVQDESGGVTTTVQLRDGPATTDNYLYLSSGETLYSNLDKPTQQALSFDSNLFSNSLALSQHLKVMSERNLIFDYGIYSDVLVGAPEYFSFDTPTTSTLPVRAYVGFERSGHELAGEYAIELPPAFRILTPVADAVVTRATPIELTWSDADTTSTMELDVAGICTDSSRYNLHLVLGAEVSTGSYTLNTAEYFPATIDPAINCRVAILLQRGRLAYISTPFAFGSFSKGVQQRTVQFTSTP